MQLRTLSALMTIVALAGCGQRADPGTMEDREQLRSRIQAALADFKVADPSLGTLLAGGKTYAIFPRVITAAVGFGGGHGDGEVYEKGVFAGYADVSQASVGAQLGGQRFAELIIFQNEGAFLDFTQGTLEFDAKATAVAASKGAAATADYRRGVLVFTLPEGGLMAQAAIGGQKFRFTRATP